MRERERERERERAREREREEGYRVVRAKNSKEYVVVIYGKFT